MAQKLVLISMLLTAMTLGGCGGGGGDASSNNPPPAAGNPAPPAEPQEAEEPAPEVPAPEVPAPEEPAPEEPAPEEPAPEEPAPATASLELLHASPDAPEIRWFLDGTLEFSSAAYKSGSAFITVEEGDVSVSAEAVKPDGSGEVVVPPTTITVAGNERISLIAAGEYQHLTVLKLTAADLEHTPGHARLRVVHAAPNVAGLDIHATTAPDHDISGASLFSTLAFADDFGSPDVPADTYRIQVTEAGDASTVWFDSGDIDLADGADLLVAIVQNTGVGDAPISLVVLDGQNVEEVLDVDTPAAARVVHAAPDAPVLDVVVNGSVEAWDLIYGDVTPYLTLPAGTLTAQVRNQSTGDPVMDDSEPVLEPGYAYTALAIGLMPWLDPLILEENNRRVATEARLRFVNAAPSGGDVDIFVTPVGIGFEDTDPAFSDVAFAPETDYLDLRVLPGQYTVTVTAAGTLTAEVTLAIDAAAHGIYTAVLGEQIGGGPPLQFILMDDLDPTP